MNSTGLQQNLIWLMENKSAEAHVDPNRRLCCEKCRFSTKDIELFERHVAHHEQVTFSCTLCSHVSYSRVESQRHIVKHKGSFPYKCNWCSYGAVRRDYMVKHIQRIHGKPANGSFTTDCALSAKMEHLTPEQTTHLCSDAARTLSETVQNLKFVSNSTGNVFNLLPSGTQSKTNAPYLVVGPVHQATSTQNHLICSTAAQPVTSATCVLPVTKSVSTPQSVPSTSYSLSKAIQGTSNPLNVMVNEGESRFLGRTFLGKATSSGALPRVHVTVPSDRAVQQKTLLQGKVGAVPEKPVIQSKTVADCQVVYVSADRATQQKTLLQSQVGTAAERTVIQSKTVADSQVVYVSEDRTVQQRPLLHNQVGATTEIIQSKAKNQIALEAASNIHLKTLLSNSAESFGPRAAEPRNVPPALPAQRSFHTGVIRNVQPQRSVPPGAHPSVPAERPVHGAQGFAQVSHNVEKTGRKKTRPNILVRRPVEKLESSKQSKVQVELLAPLNQPIEHNRPLTVSCPEEITIPAGCLVELVEVKNVNGSRELELRLVPQQSAGPQTASPSWSTTAANAGNRLSFKCKVSTDDKRPRLNSGTSNLQANEQQVKASHLKEHSKDVTVDVKDEPEVTEQVLCSRMSVTEIKASSSGGYSGVLKSLASPSESNKVTSQAPVGLAQATTPVIPARQICYRGGTMSQSSKSLNIAVKGLECKVSSKKHENAESSYQGLPVISSVFSLCPSPKATLNAIDTRVGHLGKAQTSSNSGNEGLKKEDDTKVCDLKTEEETVSLTEKDSVQKLQEKNSFLKDTMLAHSTIPKKTDDVPKNSQMSQKDLPDKVMSQMCSFSTDVLQTPTAVELLAQENYVLPMSKTFAEQNEEIEMTQSASEIESPNDLSMYPTVALARMPSLDFYSLIECAKKVPERPAGEESITAIPVLCCHSNQQNMQERAIKLVLKRRRSETENKVSGIETQPLLACFDVLPPHKKHKKEKRKDKKQKSPKVMLNLRQILVKGKTEKLWLTPLKDDQLVKVPAPNQPVVVLNHPNPLFQMVSVGVGVQSLKDCQLISSDQSPHFLQGDTPAEIVNQCPSFKMKLKKVQGQEYQVTELVLKGVAEKMVL